MQPHLTPLCGYIFRSEEYLTRYVREGSRNARRSSAWSVCCYCPILTTIRTCWESFRGRSPASHFARLGVHEFQTDRPGCNDNHRPGVWDHFMHTSLGNARNMAVFGIPNEILDFLIRQILHKAMSTGSWTHCGHIKQTVISEVKPMYCRVKFIDYGNEYKYSHICCIHSTSAVDNPLTPASPGRHDNGWECLSLPPSCESSKSRLKESAGTRWFTNVTTNVIFLFRRAAGSRTGLTACFHGDILYLCFNLRKLPASAGENDQNLLSGYQVFG